MTHTTLITGASNGIGLEFAKLCASKNENLVLTARSEDKLKALQSELEQKHGVDVKILTLDLSLPGAAKTLHEFTTKSGTSISTLINNAGIGGHGYFHERDLAKHQAMIQLNMTALTELCHYYSTDMIANGGGRILNVSSTASFMPGPLQAVYYASKSYVTSLSQALAEELKDNNITVTALCPGAVDTGFVSAGDLEGVDLWKNAKSAESVASFGYKAMNKGKLVAINEAALSFMLLWVVPLLPQKMVLKMSRQAMEK